MPFYCSPDDDDDVLVFEDVCVGLGRIVADGKTKRFVSVSHGDHVVGFDITELGLLLKSVHSAYRELITLCEKDAQKKASKEAANTEPQSTQFIDRDVGKN